MIREAHAGMSVRWAILSLAGESEDGTVPRTAEVADQLKAGGINSESKNFSSNVSAVLSDMARQKRELEMTDGGNYRLTEKGRGAWEAIKRTTQYQNRLFSIGQ